MARLILKCRYLKHQAAEHRSHLVSYIATREGAVKCDNTKQFLPATKNQQRLIADLIKSFPDTRDLFEFEDYSQNPTRRNATEFISLAIEHNADQLAKKENYVDYIANRPRVEKIGEHGLFTDAGVPVILSEVQKEVAHHEGNVWTDIISLKREDAVRLGYDNVKAWQILLRGKRNQIADAMKIPPNNLKWYAAFHNEGHHPHVHMIAYSSNPRDGFLTKQGIYKMRSCLAKDIFRQELIQIYSEQTERRNDFQKQSSETLEKLVEEMNEGTFQNTEMENLILKLGKNLQSEKGKKVYGYLSKLNKLLVNQIVDELAKIDVINQLYQMWYDSRGKVLKTYMDNIPERPPLSQQMEFKAIKNMVITEALNIKNNTKDSEYRLEQDMVEAYVLPILPDLDSLNCAGADHDVLDPGEERVMCKEAVRDKNFRSNNSNLWSEQYQIGRDYLYGTKEQESIPEKAYDIFIAEAERGNPLAMHDLGFMYEKGIGRESKAEAASDWYKKSLTAFQSLEGEQRTPYVEYRIGKFYQRGLGTDISFENAAFWYQLAADKNHKYAQYSLGGLYYDGKGVDQNYQEALHFYLRSANQLNAYADYEVGKMYRDGIGTESDKNKSAMHFKKAYAGFVKMEDERKDDNLQYRIGRMLYDGTGVEKNINLSKSYFAKSAKLNNHLAEYMLGKLCLEEGNVSEGLTWFEKAAAAKNDMAMYALGKIYYYPDYGVQDKEAAQYWLTLSAQQGNVYAQYLLQQHQSLGMAVTRLMHHLSNICRDQAAAGRGDKIDRKRWKKLQEKKQAQGHAQDDREQSL